MAASRALLWHSAVLTLGETIHKQPEARQEFTVFPTEKRTHGAEQCSAEQCGAKQNISMQSSA